ncbi:hypothetical protein BH20PSE1_BH20PSE1_20610 [soil metagenome]
MPGAMVALEPFSGDGGAGDVAAQVLKFVALIDGTTHLGKSPFLAI